jgi:seryl-tRNA synthetase
MTRESEAERLFDISEIARRLDIECWMPSRGEVGEDGRPRGDWGETHSASRLYDHQCRRLNPRSRGETTEGKHAFCHSLNNTLAASPRLLIPILEMYQLGGVWWCRRL